MIFVVQVFYDLALVESCAFQFQKLCFQFKSAGGGGKSARAIWFVINELRVVLLCDNRKIGLATVSVVGKVSVLAHATPQGQRLNKMRTTNS